MSYQLPPPIWIIAKSLSKLSQHTFSDGGVEIETPSDSNYLKTSRKLVVVTNKRPTRLNYLEGVSDIKRPCGRKFK